jgi:hypothetical protein
MSSPFCEYHSRIFCYRDKIHSDRLIFPRLTQKERERNQLKKAIESDNEFVKNPTAVVKAIESHLEHKRKQEADLRIIDEKLFIIEKNRAGCLCDCESGWKKDSDQDRWKRMLDIDKEFKDLISSRDEIQNKLERVKKDISLLRNIEERNQRNYTIVSERRSARKSARQQIA